jgi:hypothetical protein
MLFIESKTLNRAIDAQGKNKLVQELEEKRSAAPLIRSLRLRCFSDVMLGSERIEDVEDSLTSWAESTNDEPFVRGDVFCFPDYVLFLIFEEGIPANPLVRAGIIYEARTPEPFRKLEAFCDEVRDLLSRDRRESSTGREDFPQWEREKSKMPQGFRNFVERQDADSLFTSLRKESTGKRNIAASKLEDERARAFLKTARNAHEEGYADKLLSGETQSPILSLELEDAGLVDREVQISCRQTGHALFRLPNAHALAVVTVSDATCSECGSPVADESVEEVIAPTQLASSLLEDGAWMVSRVLSLLREKGVPDWEIAVGPSEGTGYRQIMANICGESFLVVTRDGDLTPSLARWVVDREIETEASHLLIIATGRIHNEAGVLLNNHSRRRLSSGDDFEMIVANDTLTAGSQLESALERVSHRVIAEQLCVLDNSIGLSLSRLILKKFQLLQAAEPLSPSPVIDSEPNISPLRAPLALAAHAGFNVGEVLDLKHETGEITNLETQPQSENTVRQFTSGT